VNKSVQASSAQNFITL